MELKRAGGALFIRDNSRKAETCDEYFSGGTTNDERPPSTFA